MMDFFAFAAGNARVQFRPPTPRPLYVTIANSIKLNDAQCSREEITYDLWKVTDVALWKYASDHGIYEDVQRSVRG